MKLLIKTPPNNFLTLLAHAAKVPVDTITVEFVDVRSYTIDKTEQGKFVLWTDKDMIACFTLVTMPGCCGILVSTGSYVEQKFQGKGIGHLLNSMRQRIAYEWGYPLMICTDVTTNTPQQKILSKAGWKHLLGFKNSRTGNDVSLHAIPVLPGNIELGFKLP
jgi:GNAT superfamily N-acetyltransferase